MTIYVTPFKASTKETTGPSTDSGFENLEAVAAVMGEPDVFRGRNMLIYGPGEERVVFSKTIFRIDAGGSTA